MFDPTKIRLGKKAYEHDPNTLMMGAVFSPTLAIPNAYNFDSGRAVFPLEMWGNDEWGDCAKVAQANEVIRLERLEQKTKTLKLTAADVVAAYKAQTGANSPGDSHDTGLVMLQNLRLWRKFGFPFKGHGYKISAFGEIDPAERQQLRAAVYLLHGVQFGFSLPLACRGMTDKWDFPKGASGPQWTPGSWGGHAVFSKCYNSSGMEVLTWGHKVTVTNAFIEKYCDEAWAVVDDFDTWVNRPEIDIAAVRKHLHDIGATHIEG